jgi:membrane protein DedA with SNARE-associated domain
LGPLQHHVIDFIARYAYGGIFTLLVLGIVGVPIPDEFLLTYVGYLVFRRHLSFAPALASAFAGSACGITISYLLGRTAGSWVLHRFGRWLHIGEADIKRAHDWFSRLGGWSLVVGYYVAGARHLTAIAAGMAEFEPPKFAAYAYTGALLWTTTFIGLGIYLGESWHENGHTIRHLLMVSISGTVAVGLIYLLWRMHHARSAGSSTDTSGHS